MPSVESRLNKATEELKRTIKTSLIEHDLTQADLSRMLNVSQAQVNRAIGGDDSPKSRNIRRKIYDFLHINE